MRTGYILAAHYPELALEWNYGMNRGLTPFDVTTGSSRRVWWKCSLGHEWQTDIRTRVSQSTGCPYCKGKKAWPGFNDIATLRPDMAALWDHEQNGKGPEQYVVHSSFKVWWTCPKGHPSYLMQIAKKANGQNCPKCSRAKVGAMCSKKVLQYSRDGELIGSFASAREADRALKKSAANTCRGQNKTCGGYVLRYADEPPKEKPPVPEEERLRDALNRPVMPGDEVIFLRQEKQNRPKLLRGTVAELTAQTVIIKLPTGERYKVYVSKENRVQLAKVLVLQPRPPRAASDAADASGYPIQEGDPVVYTAPPFNGFSWGFESGTVKKAGSAWEIDGNSSTPDRIIVVNW